MKSFLLTLLSAFVLCGCSLIEERGACPTYSDDDSIMLSFQMQTSDPQATSRADDLHKEVGSEYKQFEDGIDMKDCAMFVFAKVEGTEGEEKLIFYTTDLGSSNDIDNYITGSPGMYTVNMVIGKARLNDMLGVELHPDSKDKISIRILLLANCTTSPTDWNTITGSTYSEIIAKLSAWTYAMSNIYNPDGGTTAADLYKNIKHYAPMFGTNVTSVSQEDLYYSRFDRRVYLHDVDMLRAIAKVRVVDNIENKGTDGYPKVIGAEFIGSQNQLRQLPADAQNYENGQQVHNSNFAVNIPTLSLDKAYTYKLGTIPDDWAMTEPYLEKKSGPAWIGYVPEQKIDHLNNNVAEGMPIFKVTVALQKNEDGTEETKVYNVPMTNYEGFGSNILRNHIYTLSVDEVALGNDARLTFTVDNWIPEVFNLNYTETVTVSNAIRWLSGFEEYDATEGNVVIKPWTTNPETGAATWVPLKADFSLQNPIGATWSAYLIGVEGTPNAFVFLDNGEMKPRVSGVITENTFSELVIVSQDNEPSGVGNKAKLQIIVTLGNGTVIEAKVTPEGASYSNFLIVQNPL